MNLIAGNGHRKWPYGAFGRAAATMVTAVSVLAGMQASPATAARPLSLFDFFGGGRPRPHRTIHAPKIPLPRPRPAEAPAAKTGKLSAEKPAEGEKPAAEPSPPPAPKPSACRLALTEEIAIAPSIPDIQGPGGCGGSDLVRLDAIVLPDKHRVAVTPPATLRCPTATAIADWVRTDVAPLADKLGSEISGLDNYDSYDCRSFNGIAGAHLSEHGRADALDVHGFKLADGRSIVLTDRDVSRDFRESVLHSVCTRFMTVLGPDSDWYHEEHIHLDLMGRHNNYKICEWDVLDPLPKIAPLMPAARPEEAPPRAVAGKEDGNKGDAAKPQAAEPAAKAAAPPAVPTPKSLKQARRRGR